MPKKYKWQILLFLIYRYIIMIITILTGSYNLEGTSNTLVNEFIRGASENGCEIHT